MSEQNEQLPEWDECSVAINNDTATALQRFIFNQEPHGDSAEYFFRTQLQAAILEARRAQPAPTVQAEPVMWYEAEESARGLPLADVIANKMFYSTRMHTEEPNTKNPVWPLYAGAAPAHASSDGRDAKDAAQVADVILTLIGECVIDWTPGDEFHDDAAERAYLIREIEKVRAALAGTGVKGGGS